jgi:serine protease AprX
MRLHDLEESDTSSMRAKQRHLLLHFLLLLSLLAPLPVAGQASIAAAETGKIQGYLARLAQQEPTERVALIIQKATNDDSVERFVQRNGGTIKRDLGLINAVAAEAPASLIPQLANLRGVRRVSIDAPMINQNSGLPGSVSAQDDFAAVAYDGNDGSFAWQNHWQELGEADGADQGDVGVTAFWGGALQGLRLQGAGKGAWRAIDLSQADAAQLHLTYRRKDFAADSDYVALELSADGSTWTEAARWNGPAIDSELQSAVVDLAAYRTAQTAIRFVTSAGLSADARFYLDSVRIDFIPTWQETTQANRLYLPLAVGREGALAQADAPAAFDKSVALAREGEGRSNQCWNCINLNAIQNNYVKAIKANAVWNVSPYPRGWGVAVAVVDSGISNHPDFNDYWGNSRIVQRVSFVPGSLSPDDFYGHGTHIAGAIAGLGQASSGRYLGVAPEAKLVDVKVMDDWGYGTTSNVIAGLEWIFKNSATFNIKVVNLSLNSRVAESYHESALNAALEVLWFNKITVVVSAGNGGKQRLYPPANDPFVITVGATDDKGTAAISDDTLASFSAYGMTGDGFLKPDLVAPGTGIIAPLSGDDNNLTWSYPQNKLPAPDTRYYRMSGTSMASGVVAGAVAVLLEDEPTLSPDQIKFRLRSTAQPFSRGESCATGAGYLDLQRAVAGTSTQSANTGLQASQMLWSGSNPVTWGSVSWNSVSWNSVSWNSVSWNSVSWNSVSWNSVSWNSSDFGSGSGNGSCTSAIKKLMLVNADTDQDIQPIFDGAILNIDAIGTRNLAVRAETTGSVESVKFEINNSAYTRIENTTPYALASKSGSDYMAHQFANGNYKLKATAYSLDNASGTVGATAEIDFVVAGVNRCELEGSVHAVSGTAPMYFKVQNQSGTPLEIFWLNYGGQRQSMGTIPVGATHVAVTYVGHPWLIARDWDNSCVQLVPNPAPEATVIVTDHQLTTNLAPDSGFETGTFNSWGRWGEMTDPEIVANNTRGGSYAVRIPGGNAGIWQTVGGLQPNTTYRLRGYVKAGTIGNRANLSVKNYGADEIVAWGEAVPINPNSYTEMNLTFVTGANDTSAEIAFWRWQQGSGDVYVDDIHLAKATFGGLVTLTSVNSKKCLEVTNGSSTDGALTQQWSCNNSARQKWRIETVASGGYEVVSLSSGKCLDVSDVSTNDGASIQQWSCANGNNQRWRIEPMDNNAFRLVALHSNKCLDVSGVSTADGAAIHQWGCHDGNNQKWWITPTN